MSLLSARPAATFLALQCHHPWPVPIILLGEQTYVLNSMPSVATLTVESQEIKLLDD